MDDWARLAWIFVCIEQVHRDDGASHGDRLGNKFECVIESSTVNCVCRMSPRAFAALDNRRADVSNLESETEKRDSRGRSRRIRCTCIERRECA